jgi:hypothetical protein
MFENCRASALCISCLLSVKLCTTVLLFIALLNGIKEGFGSHIFRLWLLAFEYSNFQRGAWN